MVNKNLLFLKKKSLKKNRLFKACFLSYFLNARKKAVFKDKKVMNKKACFSLSYFNA